MGTVSTEHTAQVNIHFFKLTILSVKIEMLSISGTDTSIPIEARDDLRIAALMASSPTMAVRPSSCSSEKRDLSLI